MPAKVRDCHDRRDLVVQGEEDSKRKAMEDCPPDVAEDSGELARRLLDALKRRTGSLEELHTQTRPLALIPNRRLEGIHLRLRANPQPGHLARSQPPLETLENLLPWKSFVWSCAVGGQPLLQEFPLPVGKRHLIDASGDVIPERLDVCDLLIDRELVKARRRQRQGSAHHAKV
jgi:hypothetical protein